MSCMIINETGPLQVYDHQSCIACRHDIPVQCGIQPLLTPGIYYPKCALIVRPEEGKEPATILMDIEAECDRIIGVTTCAHDLRDETEICPIGIGTNMGLDAKYMCWPEGTTAEQIDMLVRNKKGCIWFIERTQCSPVPEEFKHLLETKESVKAAAQITTYKLAPTAKPEAGATAA